MRRLVDIALNLAGILPDHPAAQVKTEHNDTTPRSGVACYRCKYWSGLIGDDPSHLVFAVNVPRPTQEELEGVSLRVAYALHDCPDFEEKPQPESRTIRLH